jgi:hypothetical protein
VIQFTKAIDTTQIDSVNVFQVWAAVLSTDVAAPPYLTWVQLNGSIQAATVTSSSGTLITAAKAAASTTTDAVAFIVSSSLQLKITNIRILFLGDFVLDGPKDNSTGLFTGHAISAEFVRAQLPTGEIPAGGQYGLEGGTFESWFTPTNS